MNEETQGGAAAVRPESVQPFRLVKYLSLSSMVVIVAGTLALSSFIAQRAKAILVKKSEQYALLVAQNLNNQVFYHFSLPTLLTEGEIRLSRPGQYERLDRVVRNTLQGFAVDRVDIYEPEGVLTYSTESSDVGTRTGQGEFLKRALAGESVTQMVGAWRTFLGFELGGGRRKLKNFLPMSVESPRLDEKHKVLGVFEITQDVTADYEAIRGFQWVVLSSALIFVVAVFLTVILIARRAERIIAARAQERRRLEDMLHQSERLAALGEMIAGVSHEIRNPLGIIRSTAELLHSRVENDRQKRLSEIIVQEATRLNGILTEFLDYARPKKLRAAPCRVEDVLERNLQVLEPECGRRNVQVERAYLTGAYTVEADCDLIYRALVNLLANALQAMPEGGTLRVETAIVNGRSERLLECRISDTGVGIPQDARKKIFNPFFTTRQTGTGLGLPIVRSIVDSHHGTIEVESEEGKGTTMIVRLPIAQPAEA